MILFTGVSKARDPRAQKKISIWIDSLINTFKDLCKSRRVDLQNFKSLDCLDQITLIEELDKMKPKIKQLEKLKKETEGAQLLEIEECIQLFEDILTDHEKAKSGKRCSLDAGLFLASN